MGCCQDKKRSERQGNMALFFCGSKPLRHCSEKNGNGYSEMDGSTRIRGKMVEAMYENSKGRVVVGSGMSNEFQVNIGLRQGSALSPLLFIVVMELISRKISTTDVLRTIMYADDLVIVRISVRPRIFLYAKKPQTRVARSPTGSAAR